MNKKKERQMAASNPVLVPVECRHLVDGRPFLMALSRGLEMSLDMDLEGKTPALNCGNTDDLAQHLSLGARGERTPIRPSGQSTLGSRAGARRIAMSRLSRAHLMNSWMNPRWFV